MKISNSLGLLLISAKVLLQAEAEKVNFKVLAVNGTPSLSINNQSYPMEAVPNSYPLYEVAVDVQEFPVSYHYILDYEDGQQEKEEFTRQRDKDAESLNEFFGRSVTVKEHPLLPKAFEEFPYTKKSKLFDDTFVASIFVQCDEAEIHRLHDDVESKEEIKAKVIYANPYTVRTFEEASFGISGASTRAMPKVSYKIKDLKDTSSDKELFGRTNIKLRAENADPSQLREKLYGDILNSVGAPTPQFTYVRLYINGEPIGLFTLGDNVKNKKYLRATYNKGKKYPQSNPFYRVGRNGDIFGDMRYYGDDETLPEYEVYKYDGDEQISKSEGIKRDIIPLLKEIDSIKSGNNQELSLDVDSFLKYMVVEFLAGAVDNYWDLPGNCFLFKDLDKKKWYFIDNDFHYSFGTSWGHEMMLKTPLAEFPPILENEHTTKDRPLIDNLRAHPDYGKKFDEIMERLLKTSFHPSAIFPRLESLTHLIREDMKLDLSLPRKNKNPEDPDTPDSVEDFEKESTSEDPEDGYNSNYPIRYYIKTKFQLVTEELGLDIPEKFENNLGYYESASFTSGASFSIRTTTSLWCILFAILYFIFF